MVMSSNTRIERDSLGEVHVPADALYGAQTQRAVENFPHLRLETKARIYLVHSDDQARRRRSEPRSWLAGQ